MLSEEFIKIIIHDLRAPLANIVSLVQILKEDKENHEEIADLIESCGLRLLDKIEYLLKDYRLNTIESSTGIKISPAYHNINDLIKEIIYEAQGLATSKTQQISFMSSESIIGYFDKELIRVVVENILNNALKFSHDNSKIEFFLNTENEWITIVIKDQGQGFTSDDKNKIFGKHAILSAKPTGMEHSSGLGLYICKQIIDEHKGFITMQSDGRDKGAAFLISIPFQHLKQ